MRATMRAIMMCGVSLGFALVIGTTSARAQMGTLGGSRSLGGYGASTISSYYYSGSSTIYIPYQGDMGGFIPSSGGGFGDAMSARPVLRRIPETPIGGTMTAGTSIGGASLSGGMGAAPRGGMGMGSPSGTRTYLPLSSIGGMGAGSGMVSMPTTRSGGTRRPPPGPGFGYPFRMPPSLSGGGAMSTP